MADYVIVRDGVVVAEFAVVSKEKPAWKLAKEHADALALLHGWGKVRLFKEVNAD